jgi:subtilase family serine protease
VSPGTYFLLSCADSKNAVAELDETNNCKASAIQVAIGR